MNQEETDLAALKAEIEIERLRDKLAAAEAENAELRAKLEAIDAVIPEGIRMLSGPTTLDRVRNAINLATDEWNRAERAEAALRAALWERK